MMTFTLPDLGEGLQEADLVEWLVEEGDRVSEDQLILLVETAKAVVELPAPASGVITKFKATVGETIQVGQALFDYEMLDVENATGAVEPSESPVTKASAVSFEEKRESVSVVGELAKAEADKTNLYEAVPDKPSQPAEPICINAFKESKNRPSAKTKTIKKSTSSSYPAQTNKHATSAQTNVSTQIAPSTMAFAKKLGLEGLLTHTYYGELNLHDLIRIYEEKQNELAANTNQSGPKIGEDTEWHDTVPLKGARKVMAQVMTNSHQQIPAATLFDDVDISHWGAKEDITLRMIQAIVAACKAVPILNTWYENESMALQYHSSVHLGLAVNAESGLYVPVLRDCQEKSAKQLRAQVNQFRQQINDRSIAAKDLLGASISLSNFGVLTGRYATPIIVPPQVCIVGVGKIRTEPVVKNDKLEIGRVMPLSISFDHRAATGGEAAEFMYCLIGALSE